MKGGWAQAAKKEKRTEAPLLAEARLSLLASDGAKVEDVAKRGLAAGMAPEELMNDGFRPARCAVPLPHRALGNDG